MFKRNTIAMMVLSAIFMTVSLLSSAVCTQAQVVTQEGAINTSRSNIKNTSRTAGGQFAPLVLDLKNASGETVASRKLEDKDGDGNLSKSEGAFDFGILPRGDYVLAIRLDTRIDTVDSKEQMEAKAASALPNITVNLNGTKDGAMKKELTLIQSDDATSAKTKLGALEGQISTFKKPALFKSQDIIFKADGKSAVKGTAQYEAAKSSIRNIR